MVDDDPLDRRMMTALGRYQVVSTYLAMAPKRGGKGRLRAQLAKRDWRLEDGTPLRVTSGETIRSWVRKYQHKGLEGLKNKRREPTGSRVLRPEVFDKACALKRKVPERSLDRLIKIMEALEMAEPGEVRRSTLHRALQAEGLSRRPDRVADAADLDRFEADLANDLWQSDLLVGPWLPDPQRPGKVRRAYLYACLDDHSRLLLHGRFSFKGDLPALELVLRRCFQKYGLCRRLYYDNAQVYRSGHMKQIVAALGIYRIVFTKPRRPMGHGKIEALNRLIRSAFLAELKDSNIQTLDELNEAFVAWSDLEYNRAVHTETGQTPLDRWRADLDKIRFADEEALRQAFLWKERRKADKTGLLSLFGTRYQVGAKLANRRLEVRYDPEALHEVEIWDNDAFAERVRPFQVRTHRRPRATNDDVLLGDDSDATERSAPVGDYLGFLVDKRREEGFIEPTPQQLAEQQAKQRAAADEAVVELLVEQLDPQVFDEAAARGFLHRYGPFDATAAEPIIEQLCAEDDDRHVSFYLDAIRRQLAEGDADE